VASITTNVTCSAIRCSGSRRIAFRRRGPGPHCLHRLATTPAGNPNAYLGVPLRHIHSRTALVDDFHDDQLPSPPRTTRPARHGKGQKEGKSDARALSNNPRFTVETLRAMLTNGLTGTTDATATTAPTTPDCRPDPPDPTTHPGEPGRESSRPTIRSRSGDPLLTSTDTVRCRLASEVDRWRRTHPGRSCQPCRDGLSVRVATVATCPEQKAATEGHPNDRP
jgi:hypothetical protein